MTCIWDHGRKKTMTAGTDMMSFQEEKCIYILQRNASKEHLIAAFNLSDKKHDVTLNIPGNSLTDLINTNWEKYGSSVPVEADAPGQTLTLAPFSGILYKITDKVMK